MPPAAAREVCIHQKEKKEGKKKTKTKTINRFINQHALRLPL